MELFVFVLLGVAAWVLLSRDEKSKPDIAATKKEDTKATSPEPFDPHTAKTLPTRRVIEGPAWVIDGDSLVIKKTQIRLFGIDAPELDHPWGLTAKWALVALCKGQTVRAEIREQDHYGRTVARCFLSDGRDLSAEMVKQGLAIDWPKYSGGTYTHLEPHGVRKKHWKAAARQQGNMYIFNK